MTAERPGVVLALTPVAERAVEPLLFGDEATVRLVGSVADAGELAEAGTGEATAVLLPADLAGISAGHCERVRARGLRIVGVAIDDRDRAPLTSLALDAIVDSSVAPAELQAAVTGAHDSKPGQEPVPPPQQAEDGRGEGDGAIVAVVGSKGAPGSSECAASLAALACQRWPTLLVELDALGGGLAVRIGGDPHRGSVLGLLRAAQTGERALGELLERWTHTTHGGPPMLLGPPESEAALDELAAPGAVAGALRALRSQYPLTVCDVGFLLGTGADVGAAARIHREALVSADAVLVVLGARDAHLAPGLAQLDLLLDALAIPPERLRIAVNGIGGPGAPPLRALDETLVPRLAERGLTADAWLAFDQRGIRRAQRRGLPLVGARRRSPYARVLAHLLDELFLPTTPAPRRRKLRLAPPPVTTPLEQAAEEEAALPWRS